MSAHRTDAHRHDHHADDQELVDLVAAVPIFSGLGPDELADLATRVRPRHYPANHQLYGAGETSMRLLIIHTGKVKVYRLTASGHEHVIRVLGPGDFLGETSFITSAPMDHFALTVEPGEICSLAAGDMRDHLLTSPSVAVTMLETLSRRLEATEEHVSALTGETATQRIAGYLLALDREGGLGHVRLPVAKKDVASHLGVTPETLSRKLTQFETEGWVRVSGRHIDLIDKLALAAAE